jgi:hypothetical protein
MLEMKTASALFIEDEAGDLAVFERISDNSQWAMTRARVWSEMHVLVLPRSES